MSDATLQEFFSRPIRIGALTWSVGSALFTDYDPWSLYLNNTRVINRISNYKLLRGKLHIKITINGNGFYYGMAMASYIPRANKDQVTFNRSNVPGDLVAASQRPHIFIDPTLSQGGELCLPFIWEKNALDVSQGDWNSNAMGTLNIRTLNQLAHANGGTEALTIAIFAWMEDVVLSNPTSINASGIAPQAGPASEYVGPISGPMNTAARWACALQAIPPIAPYAKATEIATSGLARIAKLFGFSRPIALEPTVPYRPNYMGHMPNANIPDSSTKLTFDTKQELTVDSRVNGLAGIDEMSILSIAQRESYLVGFSWTYTQAIDTQLFACDVSPMLWRTDTDPLRPLQLEYHFTPMAFAALPFRNWRGTIRYRFQVVASAFHKGRIRITVDPTTSTNLSEYNLNYNRVVDISKERDFTIEVGWGQKYGYLQHVNPFSTTVPYTTTPTARSYVDEVMNGVISVSVVNELSAPSSATLGIGINVFVSAGDDFEVINPTDRELDGITYSPQPVTALAQPQAGELGPIQQFDEIANSSQVVTVLPQPQAGELGPIEPDAAPMSTNLDDTANATLDPRDYSIDVYFADPVPSFRQALKRYTFSEVYSASTTTSSIRVEAVLNDFPLYRGYSPGAVHTSGTGAVNFTANTLLNYLAPAYVCRRGGLRWKYILYTESQTVPPLGPMTVARYPGSSFAYTTNTSNLNGSTQSLAASTFGHDPLFSGAQTTVLSENPVLEFELPFQQNTRFFFGRQLDQSGTLTDTEYHRLLFYILGTNTTFYVSRYVSTGEDFDLSMFLSVPVMWNIAL